MFNLPIYGLTQDTINNYRVMMQYGCTHERAMQCMKAIYNANKRYATKIPISDIFPQYEVVH